MDNIRERSELLHNLEKEGKIMIVGGVHDLSTGKINYIEAPSSNLKDGGYNVGPGRSEDNYRYDMGTQMSGKMLTAIIRQQDILVIAWQ